MDVLQAMRVFSCVVQAGSLTNAAERLDTSTASVSRILSSLEAHLTTRLLNRTTRRIALTEAGMRYHKRCLLILELVETAETEVLQQRLEMPMLGRLASPWCSLAIKCTVSAPCPLRYWTKDVPLHRP